MRGIEINIDLVRLMGTVCFTVGIIYLPGIWWVRLLVWVGVIMLCSYKKN